MYRPSGTAFRTTSTERQGNFTRRAAFSGTTTHSASTENKVGHVFPPPLPTATTAAL